MSHVIAVTAVNDTYVEDEVIRVSVKFSAPFYPSGTDSTLALKIGSNIRKATFLPLRGKTDTLTYFYRVQPGDIDADGITVLANGLTLNSTVLHEDSSGLPVTTSFTQVTFPGVTIAEGQAASPVYTVDSAAGGTLKVSAHETLIGGTGTDVITLRAFANTVSVTAVETLVGNVGLDELSLVPVGPGAVDMTVQDIEIVNGSQNFDTVRVTASDPTIFGITNVAVRDVEMVIGSIADDVVNLLGNSDPLMPAVTLLDIEEVRGTTSSYDSVHVKKSSIWEHSTRVRSVEYLIGDDAYDQVDLELADGETGTSITVGSVDVIYGTVGFDKVRLVDDPLGGAQTLATFAVETVIGGEHSVDTVEMRGNWLMAPLELSVQAVETVIGSNGIDTVRLLSIGGTGVEIAVKSVETLIGTAGIDTVRLLSIGATGANMCIQSVETLIGTNGMDAVMLGNSTGTNGAMFGSPGNPMRVFSMETLTGSRGTDVVMLADDSGTMLVSGIETLIGGVGKDVLKLAATGTPAQMHLSGAETLVGSAASDIVLLGSGGNTLLMSGIETLAGGTGVDVVTLSDNPQQMVITYIETLTGGMGADTIRNVAGSIRVEGRDGGDTIALQANGGTDQIVFSTIEDGGARGVTSGYDYVTNFQAGTDRVVLAGAFGALVDDNGDGTLAGVARTTNKANFLTDEVVVLGSPVASLTDANFTSFRAALGTLAASAPGANALVLARNSVSTGLYLVADVDGNRQVAATEIRLVGIFSYSLLDAGSLSLG